MLTHVDIAAWAEIQDGLARAAERDWQTRVIWAHYERRRREIADKTGLGAGETCPYVGILKRYRTPFKNIRVMFAFGCPYR